MKLKAAVWNMDHKLKNWRVLGDTENLRDADLVLLCEATPPPADYTARSLGHGSTEGLETALGSERPVKRPWSTAVTSRRPLELISDARVDRHYRERLPFEPSRAGTWVACTAYINGVDVTAVALYGLMDEKSDASVHRSLSEMSPLFDHPTYGNRLILGGDLNILSNPRPTDPARDRHLAVLARIKAYGLEDCLQTALPHRSAEERKVVSQS